MFHNPKEGRGMTDLFVRLTAVQRSYVQMADEIQKPEKNFFNYT